MTLKMTTFTLLLLLLVAVLPARAQFKEPGVGGGVGFGGIIAATDLKNDANRFFARAFVRYGFIKHFQAELGGGIGKMAGTYEKNGTHYETQIAPFDLRLLYSPFSFDAWNLFLYGGAGMTYFNYLQKTSNANADPAKSDGWTAAVPVGAGLQLRMSDNVAFEGSAGYNYTLSERVDAVLSGKKDAYWTFLLGLTATGDNPDGDPDGDGLTNREEKQFGTDPKNADTDGDGLTDGQEVKTYNTNPLKADTDGDGLKDGEEVLRSKTDPLKADTDGDGLNDFDELNKYNTDPLKADTDGDGLSDGDEVLKYKTNPLKADTDGDGLNDGEEVLKYKTDPLKADTDGGTVSDGVEVQRGTNPLDPADDVVKKEEIKVEVGASIALEGVTFKTGSAVLTPESEGIMTKAFNTLEQHPEMTVEIQGHTDNSGKRAANVKLSEARAVAVKAWLVAKGIAAERMTTKGYGPDKPAVPNTTPEGRQKNRRIEFMRTK